MEESSDDNDNEEYVPDDEDADEGQDAGDEDASNDYNYDDIGSIGSEHNEPTDDDAMDVNLGRSDDRVGVEVPENPGVDDAASDENTEMNGVENRGVEDLDNDIINQEMDDVECPEEKEDSESTEGENASIVEGCGETENERDTTYGETGHDRTSISMTPRCLTLARAMTTHRPRL